MKSIKILTVVLLAAVAISCENWLDVDPKTESKEDKMFESEQGFKDAIIGCYMLMSKKNAYGMELTAGFLEIAGQQIVTNPVAGNNYEYPGNLNWGDSRGFVDGAWSRLYETIANVNNIIENIDKRQDVLHTTSYHIIKGEAYGLRGFLHFELLRLFGRGDLKNNTKYLKEISIPYSKSYNKVYPEQYTHEEVIKMAIEDLEMSVGLLENYDPWSTVKKGADYYLPNSDGFYTNRSTHFNYWAAKAALARIYMWTGDYSKALPIIQNFIDNRPAITGLKWVTDSDIVSPSSRSKDMTFSMEHIFRLDVSKLWEANLKNVYDPQANYPNDNARLFYIPSDEVKNIFEFPAIESDYRYTELLDNTEAKVPLLKFRDIEGYEYPNRMPLIRMSEMYYLAAECLCEAGETREAVNLLNEVRQNRGIPDTNRIDESSSADKVRSEIEKEWKKEFLGEGQLFLYYKRHGAGKIGKIDLTEETDKFKAYVLPIPDEEINTGGRVDNRPDLKNNAN